MAMKERARDAGNRTPATVEKEELRRSLERSREKKNVKNVIKK